MKKIILTGPESSGKTTLAKQLATHFQTSWLPEYARKYLEDLPRNYGENDLYEIARGQFLQEENAAKKAAIADEKMLICDTSFLVLKIWSMFKYGRCHPYILAQLAKQTDVFYLLCDAEIAWEFDPLRENPEEREQLYDLYKMELKKRNADFIEITGTPKERLETCLKKIPQN